MTKRIFPAWLLLLCCGAFGCSQVDKDPAEFEPLGPGPHAVGSTNMQVADEYADIGDEAMHEYLLGRADESGQRRYLADLLKYPDAAFVVEVSVPGGQEIYGPAAGLTLPVVTFVAFPSRGKSQPNRYAFPYQGAMYGSFEDMLGPGEAPEFANPDTRYPLILLAHGAPAHGIYDVRHAHDLARHGYIVAVLNYGDDRTGSADDINHHVSFLRPLLTKAVLDALLESDTFGPHIDAENIGITGHSFGGFTALAVTGGPYLGNAASVTDARIKAGAIAAPWVGGNYNGSDMFTFGPDNVHLDRVNVPIICFFGTKDDVTLSSFILPAMQKLSGPTYVVQLIDQPHVFEPGSWEDRNAWELLFFNAYLKHDPKALAALETTRSMQGGNEDVQLFDYQKLAGGD